jgi:hypothetical protein
MFGNRRSQLKVGKDGAFADAQISQSAGPGWGLLFTAAEYEVENHFQFQVLF